MAEWFSHPILDQRVLGSKTSFRPRVMFVILSLSRIFKSLLEKNKTSLLWLPAIVREASRGSYEGFSKMILSVKPLFISFKTFDATHSPTRSFVYLFRVKKSKYLPHEETYYVSNI